VPTPKPLTPAQAVASFANRFGKVADNLRQLNTTFGTRPYRVFLVWTTWTGGERGVGDEKLIEQIEILPTPNVRSLDNVALSPLSTGVLSVGSLRLTEVTTSLTADQLTGRMQPTPHVDHIPEPIDFFYEVVEDGRGDPQPRRMKFTLFGEPHRNAENLEWQLVLTRVSEDRKRDGTSAYTSGDE
jgi:hypothetical protein